MKTSRCPESDKVEQARDGRLSQGQVLLLRQHLLGCAACRAEASRLEAVGRALRGFGTTERESLAVQKGRARLLDDARRIGARHHALSVWALGPALVVLAVAFAFGAQRWSSSQSVAVQYGGGQAAPSAALEVHVTPSPDARWSRRQEPWGIAVELAQGKLELEAVHHDSRAHLKVFLPDGEVEDIGTVFTVEVVSGRTRVARVEQGMVILRLKGRDAVTLRAGEHWSLPAEPERESDEAVVPPDSSKPATEAKFERSAGSEAAAPSSARLAPEPSTARLAPAPSHGHSPALSPREPASDDSSAPNASDKSAACPVAAAFERGVAAFRAGDYSAAVRSFDEYAAACARAAHAEDAAYLKMVAYARAGRRADAQRAASTYLRRFPTGFRRAEVAAVANGD